MIAEQIVLSRRAIACKGWRWMPGAADLWGGRVREGDGIDRMQALPDLTDPATLGCVLALVREAHEEKTAHTRPFKGRWLVERETRPYLHEWLCSCGTWGEGEGHVVGGDTEAEALVAALEAAPNVNGEHRREGGE